LNSLNEKIEIKKGKAIITKTEEVVLSDDGGVEEFRQRLKGELSRIVKSVKNMKKRADEIKEILTKIEGQEKEPIKKP